MKLEHKLESWVAQGIITEDQAQAIAEIERARTSHSWALATITGLGVVIFLTGIISLVAANWAAIPPAIKLFLYFTLQIGVGGLAFRAAPGLVREAALTAFSLLVLAGIGLISQVFNLTGDGWPAFFLWLVLVLPATLLAQSRLINHVWFIGLGITVLLWMMSGSADWLDRISAGIGVGYLCLAAGVVRPSPLPPRFAHAALAWAVLGLLSVAAPYANILWTAPRLGNPTWGLTALALCALAAITALLVNWRARNKRAAAAAAVSAALLALGVALPLKGVINEHHLGGALVFVAVWGAAGAAAGFDGRRKLFETAAAAIAVRVIIAYFEVFGSLAATGIGLIVSGGVILGIAAVWHKLRKPTLAWLEAK